MDLEKHVSKHSRASLPSSRSPEVLTGVAQTPLATKGPATCQPDGIAQFNPVKLA